MKLKVHFISLGLADGRYSLRAPNCAAALLSWADSEGALEDWTAFACIPIDACGRGEFHFQGGRAIPPEATHIHVRAAKDDLTHFEEKLFPIPNTQKISSQGGGYRFAVMSDIHLSSKPGLVKRALAGVREADALLLPGDLTNDGTKGQFELLKECIQDTVFRRSQFQNTGGHSRETLHGMKIFPVCGNHDRMAFSMQASEEKGQNHYARFQEWLFDRMGIHTSDGGEKRIVGYTQGPDGSYAFPMGQVEIIGLQAVAEQRKFLFEEGRQLDWLDQHLSGNQNIREIRWHLILCHAPLLHHSPKQEVGKNNPYLNRDRKLQEIIDRHGNVIFISGHTHLSMNHPEGCVEWDEKHGNLYINDGSVRPTDLLPGEPMQPKEWKEGTWLDITVCDRKVEIITRSVKDGRRHARGYYHIYPHADSQPKQS